MRAADASQGSPGATILADRYLLGPALSAGGTGTVYRATDLRTGGPVAVKLPHPALAADPVHRERLRREALLAASLTSPRVVRVLDLADHAGTPFLVLEYVAGESLHERLRREGRLPLRDALAITIEVARALEAAHALGIVHRDLKPQNILITDGQVKVLDFGIARAEGLSELTLTGSFVGTPHYCAPEQAAGGGDVRSDIYSLGIVLFALVEGRVPFDGPTPLAVLQQHASTPPPLTPSLPPVVRTVLVRCLAKSPDDRYQTPAELIAALTGALAAVPLAAGEATPGAEIGGPVPALAPVTTGTPVAVGTTPTPAPRRPLPAPLTPLVGREQEAAEVQALLDQNRLLTLTGPGGAGKTRLALHVAGAAADAFPDGAALVELASCVDGALVSDAVAGALGVPESSGRTRLEAVVEALRARRLLLLLDNCEHLVAAVAAVADAVLRACPGVRVLATSREALGVQGEAVWRVPPLPAPDPGAAVPLERLADYPAVRLFLDRVAAARPGFVLSAANAPAVAEICARLDGLPLALELAAARARVLSVEQIAARLDDRFRLLTGGARTALPHQQTLRAAMDWSHELLSPAERILFRRLAVFTGGATLEAAEAICTPGEPAPGEPAPAAMPGDAAGLDLFEVLDGVQALVDKSLLVREEGEDAAGPRLRMLQTVRDYAAERLAVSGEEGAQRRRHLDHFLAVATAAAGRFRSDDQLLWLARIERDHDNLRAALEWSAATPAAAPDGLRLAIALEWFWYLRGYRAEGQARLEALLARTADVPPALRARGLGAAAHLAYWTQGPRRARPLAEEGERLARAAGDPLTLAWALFDRAVVQQRQTRREPLQAWWQEAQDAFRAAGEEWGAAVALSWLGQLAYERGDVGPASRDARESLDRFRRLGDRWGTALALARVASVAELQGDLAAAEGAWREQQALARELGHRGAIAGGLSRLAALRLRRGDPRGAVALFERSIALFRVIGERRSTAWPLSQLALLAAAEPADFARARALLRESLRVWQDNDDLPGQARGLLAAATIAQRQGEAARAARLGGAAEQALFTSGPSRDPAERDDLAADLAALRAALRAALGDEALIPAWDAGRTTAIDEAVAAALAP